MGWLLDALYLLALLAFSPLLVWRSIRTGRYREGFGAKFLGLAPRREGDGPCVWFHAVSVGEVNLLAPLLAEIERRRPDWSCVISTTTQTGFALAKRRYAGHVVFYCPLDFSWAVRRALRRIRPSALVLAELELWPNLIRLAAAGGARVAVVNGRLSERSFQGYRRLKWLMRPLLGRIDLIAAQNEQYAQRFLDLGARPETVQITGSIKFDGAQSNRRNPATERLRSLANFAPDDIIFLAGSTQAPEESLALATYRALAPAHPRLRLILVPRHPERFAEVAAMLDASGLPWQRRTDLDRQTACATGSASAPLTPHPSSLTPHPRILLVDVIGELGAWWGAAAIGFVGGSISTRGGQNMIEPAAYGVAVSFGPNTQNFRDVVAALLAVGGAEVVRDGAELTTFVARCLDEPDYAAGLGRAARELAAAQSGATARTLAHLLPLVNASLPPQAARGAA